MPDFDITNLRLNQPGIRAALGDLESDVMELVWQRPGGAGVTVRDIWDEVYPTHPVMYTTIMNTMTRLVRKGLLTVERREPAHVYRATVSRDEFVERVVGGTLERLLVNFGGATIEHLRQTKDPALRDRLARLLGDVEGQHDADSAD